MSEKIQLVLLGFGLGLTVFAVTPSEPVDGPVVEQRPSVFVSQKCLCETENNLCTCAKPQPEASGETASENRGEVIQSNIESESIDPKSLPLDPQQVEPAPPAAIAVVPGKPAVFTMRGTRYDLDSFTKSYYRRPWTYPGGIDTHLQEHGVDSATIQALSHSEKERLHAAIHERESKSTGNVTSSSTVMAYLNCPGGVCPNPQYTTKRRRGLFGVRR